MPYSYSNIFAHTITSTYGTRGTQWLARLSDIIEQSVDLWGLTDLKPYSNLTYNYVLSGVMDDVPIVLKLRCDDMESEKEVASLNAFKGHGCVNVLSHSIPLGAILLERLIPGNSLKSFFPHDDAVATQIAAELVRILHQSPIPVDAPFSILEQILPIFNKEPELLIPFIAHARLLRQQLFAREAKQVLLHGDFHHGNILYGDQKWLVIDPEGIIGDPVYDLAVYT